MGLTLPAVGGIDATLERISAEWRLIELHVPSHVLEAVGEITTISIAEGQLTFWTPHVRRSISVDREAFLERSGPEATAAGVRVGDFQWIGSYADLELIEGHIMSGGPSPFPLEESAGGDPMWRVLERFAEDWRDVERHVPSEIRGTFGEVWSLQHDDRRCRARFNCDDAQVLVLDDHLDEPNPLGSTTAVTVGDWPREGLELGVRFIATYSDGDLVEEDE
jgi:hypothetical protein